MEPAFADHVGPRLASTGPVVEMNEAMNAELAESEDYLGAGEAARMLRVSTKTISRWADKGLVPCVTTLGGHRRFRRSAVESIRRQMYGGADDESYDDGS